MVASRSPRDAKDERFGAHHYIDSDAADVAASIQKLVGARIVAATVTSAKAMTSTLAGLGSTESSS